MLYTFFSNKIKNNFIHTPTEQQNTLILELSKFLTSKGEDEVFMVKGYAGTGKTSLVGALVKTLIELKQEVVLLAPTGRAAKVFSLYANTSAYTIHKKIYREHRFGAEDGSFDLMPNLHSHTVFIVDEASMIANQGFSNVSFGTGRLLDDLVHYVYSGTNCRMILMGDTAQLPPVGEEESPALNFHQLESYNLKVHQYELTDVVRQDQDSGILANATHLRELLQNDEVQELPQIIISKFPDIKNISGMDLIEEISSSYGRDGMEDSIVICRSNKRANLYNKGIRGSILYREEELSTGDLLMVNKNNYFWSKDYKEMDFIANGEIVKVVRLRGSYELYGFRFADATISFPDYEDYEMEVKLLLNVLHSDTAALPQADQERLFHSVMEDYADIPLKRDRYKKLKEDPHFNALQVKFAYAITGHKAQGGQWKNVFLDQGYMSPEYISSDYFKWLYTAFTRATGTLYLVNYPEDQLIKE